MKRPRVSIIIPNWNGERFLKACLDGVMAQTYKDFDVTVLDDCSTDRSVEIVRKYPQVRLIENKERLGFAGNATKGFSLAQGELIATLDNDAVPSRTWLEELVTAIDRYGERTAIVEGEVTHGEGVGILNGSLNIISQNTTDAFGDDLTRKFYSGFCSSVIRNKDVAYDPLYFFFQAEPYLGWLMRLRGFDVRREPRSKVVHHGSPWRTDRHVRMRYEMLNERYRLLNILTFFEAKTLLKVLPLNALFTSFRFLALLPKEPWKCWYMLLGPLWIVTHLKLVAKKRLLIQRQRKVVDSKITTQMSCRIFPETSVTLTALNRAVARYCRLVRLPTIETVSQKI